MEREGFISYFDLFLKYQHGKVDQILLKHNFRLIQGNSNEPAVSHKHEPYHTSVLKIYELCKCLFNKGYDPCVVFSPLVLLPDLLHGKRNLLLFWVSSSFFSTWPTTPPTSECCVEAFQSFSDTCIIAVSIFIVWSI